MLKDYDFFNEKPSKHLTVFSPKTVNIKILATLTANTKNCWQITLNTKPHSDPLTNNPTKVEVKGFALNKIIYVEAQNRILEVALL